MENAKKFYLVSFGRSDTYRYEFTPDVMPDSTTSHQYFKKIEDELNAYLESKFPGQTFAYFTSAKATEIAPSDWKKYKDYPVLDAKAIGDIEKVLANEVRDMDSLRTLNDDAPFNNVPA